MAEQAPEYPLAHPYGGKGPLILGITWTEASIAFVLILMRTYTNAFVVKSFKWDYFWAILTLVGRPFYFSLVKEILMHVGHRHDYPGSVNSICLMWTRQPYLPPGATANISISENGIYRPMLDHSIHWFWEVCRHCLYSTHPRSNAKQENDIYNLCSSLYCCLQFCFEHCRSGFGPYFMFADSQILESSAPRKLQSYRPHQTSRILSSL